MSSSASNPVQVLHPDGELASPESWFPELPTDSLSDEPFLVVAITGPQSTGKSTLLNALFSTDFPVPDRRLSVGGASTAGIVAQRATAMSRDTLVFDVEGPDTRSRSRDSQLFAAKSASFVSALADIIIVNLWFHDACRYDSSAYTLIRSILNSSAQVLADGDSVRSALLISVRDVDDDSEEGVSSLEQLISQDVCFFLSSSKLYRTN